MSAASLFGLDARSNDTEDDVSGSGKEAIEGHLQGWEGFGTG